MPRLGQNHLEKRILLLILKYKQTHTSPSGMMFVLKYRAAAAGIIDGCSNKPRKPQSVVTALSLKPGALLPSVVGSRVKGDRRNTCLDY